MDLIYSLMDIVLPFSWAEHTFMKNALLAVLLITPLFGILGTMVVSNRMAFFADSLGHSAFTGIALGTMLGLFAPRVSLILFSVLFAVFIIYVKRHSRTSTDTIISVFSSAAIAFGLMLMSQSGSFNKYSSFLIGDLLSVSINDIKSLALVFVTVVGLWALLFNRLLILSVNLPLARSRGINTWLGECLFAVVLAAIVAVSIEWVGVLIINSLLVLPAAGATNIAVGMRQYHLFAVAIAMVSGLVGLMVAYYMSMAAGAAIALTAALIFFLTLTIRVRQ